jgi:ferredoxin
MSSATLPIGCFVKFEKQGLQELINALKRAGYRVLGPRCAAGAIVLDAIDSIDELPRGWVDAQEPGRYRLESDEQHGYFTHVVGPHSLKSVLFPPRVAILETVRRDGIWEFRQPEESIDPVALIGLRACDLKALAMMDRIFLDGPHASIDYANRRAQLLIVAVNCGRAAETCFCHSMDAGPTVTGGFDLALTEMADHFVVEVGTEEGGKLAAATSWVPCSTREVAEAQQVPRELERAMNRRRFPAAGQKTGRFLDTSRIKELLLQNLEHPEWDRVAGRCLACGNCTMVCPTCFCSTVEEMSDLTGEHVRRVRLWESCFNAEHSYMNSGTVRKSIAARYRQWLTHKLGSWHDQFGSSGCVGCGRCITWCPVGIDLTEEVAAIRESTS